MSAQTNITVFDGATTPVSHVLLASDNKALPDGTRYVLWRELLSSVPDQAQVAIEIRERKLKSGVIETRTDYLVPVMESVAGQNASGYTAAPKVAFVERRVVITYRHPRSTLASRNVVAQLSRNFENNVSTSVAAVAAGPEYEAHILGVLPS